MSMARASTVICLLWLICVATAASAPRPTWLYAPAVPCGELLEDSLAPPPGAVAMAVLPANVTRTYTCPDVQAYTATVDFFAPGGELAATLESTANTQDRPITFLGADGTEIGSLVTDQASEYAVVVDPATASWTRRAVKNVTGELQGAAFLVREDTRGVANPGCGGVADGVAVTSNYQAIYVFYGCGK